MIHVVKHIVLVVLAVIVVVIVIVVIAIVQKKKMIVPTFILSAFAFILILIEMMTKVSDTNTYI